MERHAQVLVLVHPPERALAVRDGGLRRRCCGYGRADDHSACFCEIDLHLPMRAEELQPIEQCLQPVARARDEHDVVGEEECAKRGAAG